ncbi:MAG: c-type cytochrome [Deltaproteobacteria bacterium]|nr:c-type cytochrome [Deltaproteobacteria bacterium]
MSSRVGAAALSGCLMLLLHCARADPDTTAAPRPELTYQELCAACHGERRYGGYAPPLIPATLQRKHDDVLVRSILDGLPSTQMPAFGERLTEDDASAIVALLRSSPGEVRWTLEDIAASRTLEEPRSGALGDEIDRAELILVVERGTGSVSVLDGDSLEELDRFFVGRIHGGIKFDHDFHRALAVTRDGTLVQYDLDRGAPRVRVKVGVNTRNVAVSGDGQFVAVANQLPQSLVILDESLVPLARFPLDGQPSAVYQVPGRQRFIVTLRDRPMLYFVELPGLQMRAVQVEEPFEDFVFVPGQPRLVASSRGGHRLVLYDYARNAVVDSLPIEGLPHLFSASFFEREGVLHAGFNHMGVPRLSIIDMEKFEVVRKISMAGAGYFTRTHPGSPYLWVDSNSESIELIDKRTLELQATKITPEPGKKAMHVEFTADGEQALVSVWHPEGAVVVFDSTNLRELRRIPYAMPVGKYNPANKTRTLR